MTRGLIPSLFFFFCRSPMLEHYRTLLCQWRICVYKKKTPLIGTKAPIRMNSNMIDLVELTSHAPQADCRKHFVWIGVGLNWLTSRTTTRFNDGRGRRKHPCFDFQGFFSRCDYPETLFHCYILHLKHCIRLPCLFSQSVCFCLKWSEKILNVQKG